MERKTSASSGGFYLADWTISLYQFQQFSELVSPGLP